MSLLVAAIAAMVLSAGYARAEGGPILIRDLSVSPPIETLVSAEQIAALETQTIVTRTEFTDGEPRFDGPLMTDVLKLAGNRGWTTARMIAANDYSIEIPVSDFISYGVIVAHSMNGKRLSRRDKGPYWLMYPLDRFAELRDPVYNNRLIWQLVTIELR
ncbi:MAG: hypothetical protein RQ752_03305 [Thermohalobaculum sp.]|nr:hypothetical protein [Thermohalobaculum sp.]